MSAEHIEKKVLLRAPRERVWQAISDSRQFGTWFGMAFEGPFVPGTRTAGRIVPTSVDPQVAKLQKPYEGTRFELAVVELEPMRTFSFRWQPFGVDPDADFSPRWSTLVVFELADAPGGTLLTLTESGFAQLEPRLRSDAFTSHEGGWTHQMRLIEKYLALNP
ncbi:MAG TPA: SRPBCC family protein [Steroidobacteraceae bacterium]|nr:SRPBCC family protein [Steroidobacteraceae bacterium]